MTCKHCCGADRFFDQKMARREMKAFRQKGTKGATDRMIAGLKAFEVRDKTLLDIGGGIGAIQWFFLESGGATTMDVDASAGYIAEAITYRDERSWQDRASFIQADFLDAAGELGQFDFVALDKVICCYPDFKKLLAEGMAKSREVVALTYPMGGVLPQVVMKLVRFYFRIVNNPFRTFVHPPAQVHALMADNGFTRIVHGMSFPWLVSIYKRG